MNWKPGDRVIVRLPVRKVGTGKRLGNVSGTVRETDTVEGHRGVRVDLDYPVNGVRDCYATHEELRRADGR